MPQRRSTFDFGAGTPKSPPAEASEGTEEILTALRNGVPGETLALLDELKNPPTRTWQKQAGLLAISLVLFFSVGLFQWSVRDLAIVIAALVVHESGHYLVMRTFGYRDLRMFFIPFVGAAVSGWAGKAHGYQRTLVALAGPVPGILFGLVLAVIFVLKGHPLVGHAAALFLAINGFNLLPLLPLDGGRVLEETLFCRSRWMEAGFQVVAGLALLVIAILASDMLLGVLGAAVVVAAPASLRVNTIAAQLRDAGEAPDIASPSDATLTFLVRISTEIEQGFSRPLKPRTLAAHVRTVVERMNRRAPSAGATVLLLGAYAAAFVLTLVGVGLIAAGDGIRGDTAQAVRARLSAPESAAGRAKRSSDLYSAGQQAYWRKDYATAIQLWNSVVADDPRHPHAWDAIGLAYSQTGQWAEAVAAISEQLKVSPSHDQAWINLGWALQHVGKPQEAISAYRKQIAIKPRDKWAHKELGLLLLDAHEWKDASTELRQAAAITPNDTDIDVALGRACVKLGDVAAGVEAFEHAKKNAWYGLISELAVYLAQEGVALDRADAWAKEATARAAAQSLILTIDTVTMADTQGSWGLSWSWYASGLAAYERGDLATAERYLRAAHSVRASAEIVRDLGKVIEKMGRRLDARRLYAEALALGSDEEARSHLAAIGVRDGEIDSLIADARQIRNNRLAIPLGKGELPAGPAEALILFTNGRRGAAVRAVRPNPNLEVLLARARTASYPVQFPDDTSAQVAGWGEVRCVSGDCALLLALGMRPRGDQ